MIYRLPFIIKQSKPHTYSKSLSILGWILFTAHLDFLRILELTPVVLQNQ